MKSQNLSVHGIDVKMRIFMILEHQKDLPLHEIDESDQILTDYAQMKLWLS